MRGVDYIYADLTDAHGRSPYFFGCNDGKIRELIRRIVRPGDTVLDVGASYGGFSLLAARLVGPSGHVHAFEPQRRQADMLTRSAEANGFRQLTIHPVALSDREGEATMYLFEPDSGFTSFSRPEPGHRRTEISVQVMRGDNCLDKLNIDSIRLLKIDTEKHEDAVLRGAASFLNEKPPAYIIFEHYDPLAPFWEAPVIRQLLEMGYRRLFEIPRTLLRVHVRPLKPGVAPHRLSENFVALHQSADESTLRP